MAWYEWRPYVPVAQRRSRARQKMQSLRKRGIDIQPVEIDGRKIAKTFWGEAWCEHLESFSDYANRLPRGRSYVRNGSVCHLDISKGEIEAKVAGSDIYNLCIKIKTLPKKKWHAIKQRCAGQVGSLLELLQGKLSDHVMGVVTDRKQGLFPLLGEISLNCDCPDWATMCKHVAAVLYGVGARLDERPELLFQLRGVNHEELIEADAEAAVSAATTRGKSKRLATDDLSDVFGIDIAAGDGQAVTPRRQKKTAKNNSRTAVSKKQSPKKKAAKKKTAKKKTEKKKTGKAAKKKAGKTTAKKATRKTPTKKKTVRKKKDAAKKATQQTAKKKTAKRTAKKATKKKPTKRRRG